MATLDVLPCGCDYCPETGDVLYVCPTCREKLEEMEKERVHSEEKGGD